MAKYIQCDKCGSEEFYKVVAVPIQKPPVKLEERKLVCAKCEDELTADEVNEALNA